MTTRRRMLVAARLSEAEALEGAKQGDSDCFKSLYALHKKRVYSVCFRVTGDINEAEELTQDAFFQLYRKIASFRGESTFSNWLHRLTVNVILMQLRKKALPEVSLDGIPGIGDDLEFGFEDRVLTGSIDRVSLERAVESLAPDHRCIFVLHDVEGYEHNEIAKMLGCSTVNSRSQLHRAGRKLRDFLMVTRARKNRSVS